MDTQFNRQTHRQRHIHTYRYRHTQPDTKTYRHTQCIFVYKMFFVQNVFTKQIVAVMYKKRNNRMFDIIRCLAVDS